LGDRIALNRPRKYSLPSAPSFLSDAQRSSTERCSLREVAELPSGQWFIEPAALRAADMRSAFAPFAASIAAHSSFEWQVRVAKFEPVTAALRHTGFAGFGVVTAVASGVPVAVDCANPALELRINAAAIISFIMRLQYVRGAYLHRS
jgi:hypothetical protein